MADKSEESSRPRRQADKRRRSPSEPAKTEAADSLLEAQAAKRLAADRRYEAAKHRRRIERTKLAHDQRMEWEALLTSSRRELVQLRLFTLFETA